MQSTTAWVRIESKLTDDTLQVERLDGRETISQLFEFEALVVLPGDTDLDPHEIISTEVTLVFEERDRSEHDGRPRELFRRHGLVVECRDRMLDESFRAYDLRIVPRFWLASLVETLDIFMGLSVPDIIRRKLAMLELSEGSDYEMRLQGQYEPREFIVQYKETDLDFIGRLTEHWGICYFFEHRQGRDVLVFADFNGAFQPAGDDGRASMTRRGERTGVFSLERTVRAVPRMFVQRDYNYRKPGSDITASSEMPDGFGGGIVEYGGHFKTEEEGKYLANVRAEEQRVRRWHYDGQSQLPGLLAGSKLLVERDKGADVPLILTTVRHRARQATMLDSGGDLEPYVNEIEAIPEEVTYRPPRRTVKPRVHGVLTGIVDAEQKGEYAELDEEGRYKIKFMFDTSGPEEGKASRAVRMMQPHTGPGYGMHFPLRPGVEVLVTFVDGDPDRPIIAGTVPNPQTASPVTGANAPRNVIRTGAGNEINIDDAAGEERIKLSTPHLSTVFQIGSPNAPEMGAMTSTFGAVSNLSVMGQSTVSSIGATVSAFRAFSASNVISTVAEPTTGWAKFLLSLEAVGALAGIADGILKEVENISEMIQTGADDAAAGSELVTKIAEQKYQAASDQKDGTVADLPALPTALDANGDPEVVKDANGNDTAADLRTSYEAHNDELEALFLELDELRGDHRTAVDTHMTVIAADKQKEIDAKEAEIARKKAILEAAESRLESELTAIRDNPATTASEKKAAEDYLNMMTAATAFRQQKAQDAEVKQNTDDITAWLSDEGYVGGSLKTIRTVFDIVGNVAGWFNMLCQLISFIKEVKEKFHEEGQWARSALTFKDIVPQIQADPKSYGFGIDLKAGEAANAAVPLTGIMPATQRHTIGSKGTMTMFGDKRAFIHSPLVVLSGTTTMSDAELTADLLKEGILIGSEAPHTSGSVVTVAEKDALVLAKEKAELNGVMKTVVASQTEVLLSATEPKLSLLGVPSNDKGPEAKMIARNNGSLEMSGHRYAQMKALSESDKTVAMVTAHKEGSVTVIADEKIAGETKGEIKLEAAKSAELLADTVSLFLDGTGGQAELATFKTSLCLSDSDGATISASPSEFYVNSTKAALTLPNGVVGIDAAGVTVAGLKIEVAADTEVVVSGKVRTCIG